MPIATQSRSPLDGLVQQIFDDTSSPPARWLLSTTAGRAGAGAGAGGGWTVRLWREGEAWLGRGWGGKVPDDKVAAALADGLVHLDASAGLALRIHTAPPTVVELARAADGDEGTDELLRATFTVLSRPKDEKDKRELRQLRAKVVEQEAEIASLHAKLASARANVVRSSQASQSQKKTSPKKPPANASLLQPNVKRRKVVQDEFAGSDSD